MTDFSEINEPVDLEVNRRQDIVVTRTGDLSLVDGRANVNSPWLSKR